ncbi:hypothetical protein ANDA3_3231 [plant metagenome]|uniref:Uncharacterized protein n=1 Tax=plant metagenome TaxID=1297885 RepID=A0A484S7Q8_9ZZZZ
MTPLAPSASSPRPAARRRWLLAAGGLALAAVLGIGFWGYMQPGMMLNWETVAAFCGF